MTSINDDDDDDCFTIQLEDSRDVQMHFEVMKTENFAAVFSQYSKMKDYSRKCDDDLLPPPGIEISVRFIS
jgi:hypothetical protein